jgi:hypothetical protein
MPLHKRRFATAEKQTCICNLLWCSSPIHGRYGDGSFQCFREARVSLGHWCTYVYQYNIQVILVRWYLLNDPRTHTINPDILLRVLQLLALPIHLFWSLTSIASLLVIEITAAFAAQYAAIFPSASCLPSCPTSHRIKTSTHERYKSIQSPTGSQYSQSRLYSRVSHHASVTAPASTSALVQREKRAKHRGS